MRPKIPDLRIEISEYDFCVMCRALIVYVLEFSVEGILNHMVLLFRIASAIECCQILAIVSFTGMNPEKRWRSLIP